MEKLKHLTKPKTISLKHSMSVGTAGLTAMLSVIALQECDIDPSKGEILVTGASGGVGNISVLLLNKLGYQVTAVTGRSELSPYLKSLGASNVIGRDEILSMTRPLNSSKWAGAIDTTGGKILANIIAKRMKLLCRTKFIVTIRLARSPVIVNQGLMGSPRSISGEFPVVWVRYVSCFFNLLTYSISHAASSLKC